MRNRHTAGLAIAVLVFFSSVITVYAGNINAAEQTVIDYYNQTISHNGKNYQFTEAAKQQAYNKLNADGVDLTAAQAASAIRQANANIQQGIAQGYLVEVSQSGSDTETADPDTADTETADTETTNTEEKDTEIANTEQTDTENDSETAESKSNETNDDGASSRPVYSDAQKTDLGTLLQEVLEEGEYAAVNVGTSQSTDSSDQDWAVTVEQFLKGTVNIVSKSNDVILSSGLPIKNTGYYSEGINPAAAIGCIFCGILIIAALRNRKGHIGIPILTAAAGIAVVVAFASGFMESETGKWKSIWILGAPEYTYGAQAEEIHADAKWSSLLQGEQYGEILCEEVHLQTPLYYGDTEEILEQGAGTYAGANLPGQGGEILVGGHDTTFFAPLEFIQEGMILSVKTRYGQYKYEVTGTEILDVMEYEESDSETEELVLYTCYPFGAEEELRTERFFVYARKVSEPEIGE